MHFGYIVFLLPAKANTNPFVKLLCLCGTVGAGGAGGESALRYP